MFPTKWTYFVALLPPITVIIYVILVQSPAYEERASTDREEIRELVRAREGQEQIEQPIVHLASLISGREDYLRAETLIKSILLFHRGSLHYHFIADSKSREVISALLQTWQIENFRWSIYESGDDADRLGWIRSSRPGGFSQLELVLDEILPRYVEKIILIDTNVIMLDDISTLATYFDQMEDIGAVIAKPSFEAPASSENEPVGISLFHLRKMREGRWQEAWHKEAARITNGIGSAAPTERKVFESLATKRPELFFSLPLPKGAALKVASMLKPLNEDTFVSRIQKCIAAMDGSFYETSLKNQTFDQPRTLKFLTFQVASETHEDVTLLLQAPASRVTEEIESTLQWPGPVTLTAYGTDEERLSTLTEVRDAKRAVTLHYMYKTEKPAPNPIGHMMKLSVDTTKTSNVFLVDKPNLIDYSKELYTLVQEQREMNASDIHVIQTADMHPIGAAMSKMIGQRVVAAGKGYMWAEAHLNLTTSFIVMSSIPEIMKIQRRDKIVRQQRKRRQGVKPASEWCQGEIEMLLRKSNQRR